jgi:hypothetical protein
MRLRFLSFVASAVMAGTFGLTNARASSVTNGLGPAAPDPAVTVDAGWYGFCFGGPGSPATAGCQNSGIGVTGNDITFTAASNVLFEITDAFSPGDSFKVYVDGVLDLTTPSVSSAGSCSTADPNAAYVDPCYSHGSISLGSGSYTVDVFAANSPFGSGGAYLQVVTAAVPEPNSISLLLAGMAVLGLLVVRKRLHPLSGI